MKELEWKKYSDNGIKFDGKITKIKMPLRLRLYWFIKNIRITIFGKTKKDIATERFVQMIRDGQQIFYFDAKQLKDK